ncbi:MAG: hypothetical protein QW171_04190 [Candidatus Bilamarchaeaceae archaeon]
MVGQIITLSERAVLDQNFKKNKKLNNYITTILRSGELLSEIKRLQINMNEKLLTTTVSKILEVVKKVDKNLLQIRPTPAELIIKSSGEDYDINDYVADIVQLLSCKDVIKEVNKDLGKINTKSLTDF